MIDRGFIYIYGNTKNISSVLFLSKELIQKISKKEINLDMKNQMSFNANLNTKNCLQ